MGCVYCYFSQAMDVCAWSMMRIFAGNRPVFRHRVRLPPHPLTAQRLSGVSRQSLFEMSGREGQGIEGISNVSVVLVH